MGPYLKQDGGSGLRVGYVVDDQAAEHEKSPLPPSLPLLQHADLEDKLVLLRVDHNVIKKGTFGGGLFALSLLVAMHSFGHMCHAPLGRLGFSLHGTCLSPWI